MYVDWKFFLIIVIHLYNHIYLINEMIMKNFFFKLRK